MNPIQGYTIAYHDDPIYQDAKAGQFIKVENKPPCLIVNHTIERAILTRWPFKLWKTEINAQSYNKDLQKGLIAKAGYTRTYRLQLLEELPADLLFGDKGAAVSKILDKAVQITQEQVSQLFEFDYKDAEKHYSKAWDEWLKRRDKVHRMGNNQGVIYSGGSPLNHGLSLISNVIHKRAIALLGKEKALIFEDDECYLVADWSAASTAFLHAAMASRTDLLSANEAKQMLIPFKTIFGTDQDG